MPGERADATIAADSTDPHDLAAARAAIRKPSLFNQYRYHIEVMPQRLGAIARDLDVTAGERLLDYGCADMQYRDFFPADVDYHGADLAGNPLAAVILNDDGTVPAPDEHFDVVMSTQVLEHVGDPRLYLDEAFRVLRPGGRMMLSTHGVFRYHPDPDDYWRWTGAGLRREAERAGFEVVRFEGLIGMLPTGLQLAQDAIYWRLPSWLRGVFALISQSVIKLADRWHDDESRAMDAQVFALIARKPG